ncbi:MAG: D-2-hydroxyacid dehydrogenase [Phycisphaeraceae bacterium]
MPQRPRIVVLDGYTLTPAPAPASATGEPTWAAFEALGELTVHDRTPAGEVVARVGDAPCVLTNKTPLDRATLEALPQLEYVGVLATGTNVVDLDACADRGITVTNIPAYGPDSVAQHAIALLLELTSRTRDHDQAVREGQWAARGDFCFTLAPTRELAGKILAIVGMGAIGQRVARIGAAMNMQIAAAHQRSMNDVRLPGVDIRWLAVDELFAAADVLSLHCPLTPATAQLVNAQRLAMMKPDACLVNTGRGGLVDEAALAAALNEGRIGGAGLDVLSEEPPSDAHPLLTAPRCLITPHMAWATREARSRLMQIAADNLKGFLAGRPVHVVPN